MATKRSHSPAPLHGTWSVGVRAVVALSAVAVLGATVTLSSRGDAQELRARTSAPARATPAARVQAVGLAPPAYNDELDDSSVIYLMSPAERSARGLRVPPQVFAKVDLTKLKMAPQPVRSLRLRAIRTANDDGSEAATISPANIAKLVDQANAVWAGAGIQFVFDPAMDFEVRNNTVLNHDFTVKGDPATFASPDKAPEVDKEPHAAARTKIGKEMQGRIVVFFRHGDKLVYDQAKKHWTVSASTGGFSSAAGEYVAMSRGMPEKNLLAHEVGHYLHCPHPFVGGIETRAQAAAAIKKYVEDGKPVSEGLKRFDGDGISDTPPDARGQIFVDAGLEICGPVGTVSIPVAFANKTSHTYTLQPDRLNVMSYFKGCHDLGLHRLSKQQVARARNALESGNRKHLLLPSALTAVKTTAEKVVAAP
jgi:hypothetical protein